MFETLLDVVAAALIAWNLRPWWAWSPAAFAAGVLITATFALGIAEVELMPGAEALRRATEEALARGAFCMLSGKRFRIG